MKRRDEKNLNSLDVRLRHCFDLLSQFRDVVDHTNENLGNSLIRDHVGSASASDGADVQSTRAKHRMRRQGKLAQAFQRVQQLLYSRNAQLGVCGVGHAADSTEFVAKRTFRSQSKLVLGRFAVDDVL